MLGAETPGCGTGGSGGGWALQVAGKCIRGEKVRGELLRVS